MDLGKHTTPFIWILLLILPPAPSAFALRVSYNGGVSSAQISLQRQKMFSLRDDVSSLEPLERNLMMDFDDAQRVANPSVLPMPSSVPSLMPSSVPSLMPSSSPSFSPSTLPSVSPVSNAPSVHFSIEPTSFPSVEPSEVPTEVPSAHPQFRSNAAQATEDPSSLQQFAWTAWSIMFPLASVALMVWALKPSRDEKDRARKRFCVSMLLHDDQVPEEILVPGHACNDGVELTSVPAALPDDEDDSTLNRQYLESSTDYIVMNY